jgi:hypothetical protein
MGLFRVKPTLPKRIEKAPARVDMTRFFYNWRSLDFKERSILEKYYTNNLSDDLKRIRMEVVSDISKFKSNQSCIYEVGPFQLKDGRTVSLAKYSKVYNRVFLFIENIRDAAQSSGDVSSDNLLLIVVIHELWHLYFKKSRELPDLEYPLVELATAINLKETCNFPFSLPDHLCLSELEFMKSSIDSEPNKFYYLGYRIAEILYLYPQYGEAVSLFKNFDITRLNKDRYHDYMEYRRFLSYDSTTMYAFDKLMAVIK